MFNEGAVLSQEAFHIFFLIPVGGQENLVENMPAVYRSMGEYRRMWVSILLTSVYEKLRTLATDAAIWEPVAAPDDLCQYSEY